MTGEVLADRYEVLATVSRGAHASVFQAIDRRHDRPVALKVYECAEEVQREALLAEARVLLGLSPHPGLPTVRDDFFVDARYVVVMDWVEGTDLGRVLVEQGEPGLTRSVVVDCVSQVAAGLDHLHDHDPPVVHGDVKPANVIRSPTGRITLVDFGIASAGWARRRAGSRGYTAPEVAAEGRADPGRRRLRIGGDGGGAVDRSPAGWHPSVVGGDRPGGGGHAGAGPSPRFGDRPGPAAADGWRAGRAAACRAVRVAAPRGGHVHVDRRGRRRRAVGRAERRDGGSRGPPRRRGRRDRRSPWWAADRIWGR